MEAPMNLLLLKIEGQRSKYLIDVLIEGQEGSTLPDAVRFPV